jgi:hypothetical protein
LTLAKLQRKQLCREAAQSFVVVVDILKNVATAKQLKNAGSMNQRTRYSAAELLAYESSKHLQQQQHHYIIEQSTGIKTHSSRSGSSSNTITQRLDQNRPAASSSSSSSTTGPRSADKPHLTAPLIANVATTYSFQ